MCTISQIRWKPLKDSISKSKVSMETVCTDRMINCVKLIIMVIFKCYFSREHIALSLKDGVNIEIGKPTD